jgi:hypothetical protein
MKASVWLVIPGGTREHQPAFVVNVARDRYASALLRSAGERMHEIKRRHQDINMVEITEVTAITSPSDEQVCVVRASYARGCELHPATSVYGHGSYIAVDRFIPSIDEPTKVFQIQGWRLTESEQYAVERDIRRFRRLAASVTKIDIDLSRGDVVWDGRSATVVDVQ